MRIFACRVAVATVIAAWVFSGSAASAQIIDPTTTTEPPSTTTTVAPTTSTASTTTTTRPKTSTTSSSTSTTETTPPSTIPTPSTLAPDPDITAPSATPGDADLSPVFPVLSVVGFVIAAGIVGLRWVHTRD